MGLDSVAVLYQRHTLRANNQSQSADRNHSNLEIRYKTKNPCNRTAKHNRIPAPALAEIGEKL